MDKKIKILEHIAKHGDCSELSWLDCMDCPFSKIKKRPGGEGWLSCFEAVCGSDSKGQEITKTKYKLIAEEFLIRELLHQKLRENDASEEPE